VTGNASDLEMALLARLRQDDMIESLTRLDEHGWAMARAVLHELAVRRTFPMDNPRTGQARPDNKRTARENPNEPH
jgi:hypothetical protein